MFEEHNGYYIEFNFYGLKEYSVQFAGDDYMFNTKEEAKQFIDSLKED